MRERGRERERQPDIENLMETHKDYNNKRPVDVLTDKYRNKPV